MFIRKSLEHRVLPIPFHILTLWGMWCPDFVPTRFKCVYLTFTSFVIVLEITLTIELFIYLIIIIKTNQFDMEVLFLLMSVLNGFYKGASILLHRKRIENLLTKGFQDHWRVPRDNSEKRILSNYSAETWRIHLIYAMACVAGVSIKLIGPMVKSNSEIILPVPSWQPYNTNKTLLFWMSYGQQMFVGGAIISMHIGADTMLAGLILQSCIQLKLLNHRLKHFFELCNHIKRQLPNPADSNTVENKLIKQYIFDHQFVCSYAKRLNNDFAGFLVAMIIVVIPNICINVYFLSFSEIGMNVDFITSLGLFSISLFQIYLPCWYGNEVTLHSLEIRNAIYQMDWVELAPATRKALIIIMIRCGHPIRLTVGRVIPMNIQCFIRVGFQKYLKLLHERRNGKTKLEEQKNTLLIYTQGTATHSEERQETAENSKIMKTSYSVLSVLQQAA